MKLFLNILFFLGLLSLKSQANDRVFAAADSMPKFPGGSVGIAGYLVKNLQYPMESIIENQTGKAYVKFIVDTLGKVTAPEIIKSSGWLPLDKEAVRVVSKMPDWQPGLMNNKKVKVSMILPITFKNSGVVSEKQMVKQDQKASLQAELTPEEKEKYVALKKASNFFDDGMTAVNQGRYEAALKRFDSCLKYKPDHLDALYNKASMHFKLDQKKAACASWNKFLTLQADKEVEELIKKNCN